MSDNCEWNGSITWRIEDFLSYSYQMGEKLESPVFKIKSIHGQQWFIRLCPAGETEATKDYISCRLIQILEKESDRECNVDFQVSMINSKGEILKTSYCENQIFGRAFNSWGWHSFIEMDRISAELKKCIDDTLIVQCYIKNGEEKILEERNARTLMSSEKYFTEWNIKIDSNGNVPSESLFFCLEDNLFNMSISVNDGDLGINIYKVTQTILSTLLVYGKITFVDAKENVVHSISETHTYNSKSVDDIWKFPSLITEQQLNNSEYVKHNKITLICSFSVCKRIEALVPNTNSETVSDIESFLNLSEDFRSLFSNKSNMDVKLIGSDAVERQAHRSVLAARSPVFSSMFNRDKFENQTTTVDMKDVNGHTLEVFLKFLYTGLVEDMDSVEANKLLVVANKYQIPDLNEKCARILKSKLSVEQFRAWAEFNLEKLSSLDFVAENSVEILSSPECWNWIK